MPAAQGREPSRRPFATPSGGSGFRNWFGTFQDVFQFAGRVAPSYESLSLGPQT
jgi:hypothetical protein